MLDQQTWIKLIKWSNISINTNHNIRVFHDVSVCGLYVSRVIYIYIYV